MEEQPGQPPLLNRAGRAYVIGSIVLSGLVVLVLFSLVTGLWRGSLLWLPRAVIATVIGMLTTKPLQAGLWATLAVIVIGGSAYFARRRARNLVTFVGEPKDDVTVATGVLLLLGDVTKGVVITILELISD